VVIHVNARPGWGQKMLTPNIMVPLQNLLSPLTQRLDDAVVHVEIATLWHIPFLLDCLIHPLVSTRNNVSGSPHKSPASPLVNGFDESTYPRSARFLVLLHSPSPFFAAVVWVDHVRETGDSHGVLVKGTRIQRGGGWSILSAQRKEGDVGSRTKGQTRMRRFMGGYWISKKWR
jgi:hypothetical protein